MTRIGRCLCGAALLTGAARSADAQEPTGGDRIRLYLNKAGQHDIRNPDGSRMTRVTGALISATPETVTVRIDDAVARTLPRDANGVVRTIPRDAISGWERSLGGGRRWRGARNGLVIGLALGAGAGVIIGSNQSLELRPGAHQPIPLMGAASFGACGAVLGATVGALVSGERWQRGGEAQAAQVSLVLRPTGVGGGVRLSF